jgi:hypothetical protein
MGWNMEGYIIKSVNHMNGFTIKNYQPNMDELEMQKIKTRIIKQLQFIFSNDTKSFDT